MKKNKNDKSIEEFDFPEMNEDIEDVKKSTLKVIKKYYMKEAIIILSLSLFIIVATLILTVNMNSDDADLAQVVFVLVFSFVGYQYGRVHNRIKTAFLKQFAKANGLSFSRHGQWNNEAGSLFKIGYGKKAYNFIKGEFMGRPLRLFEYKFTVKSGKNSHTYKNTVFCLDLEADLPHMYLDAYREGDKKAPMWQTSGLKKISLESNEFDSQYRLFITEGQHIPALQIFTPDIMANLMDFPRMYRFDIEFTGNKLYIYEPKEIITRAELQSMYSLAKQLIENLSPVIGRVEKIEK